MKWIAIPMCLLLVEPALAQSNEEILRRLDAIEKRLDQLETKPSLGALIDQATQNTQDGAETGKSNMAEPPQPNFSARLLEASFDGKDARGRQGVKLSVAVTNNTGRDATLINAHVAFTDKLGNSLGWVTWEKSRGIRTGKTQSMTGTFTASLFDKKQSLERLVEIDRELLDVTFEVFKIAYKDGEIVKIKDCQMCDF